MAMDLTTSRHNSASLIDPSPKVDKTSTLAEVSERRGVSITFLRKEIQRGRLRAIVLAPDSHRKKVRIFYRDELAWLESNIAQSTN